MSPALAGEFTCEPSGKAHPPSHFLSKLTWASNLIQGESWQVLGVGGLPGPASCPRSPTFSTGCPGMCAQEQAGLGWMLDPSWTPRTDTKQVPGWLSGMKLKAKLWVPQEGQPPASDHLCPEMAAADFTTSVKIF